VSSRVGATCQILALMLGEEPDHGLLAFVREKVTHPLKIHQVDPDSDEFHR
jgi:hypothetical protein